MALNYDFDIYTDPTRAIFAAPKDADEKPNTTVSHNRVALFRDPKTVHAFRHAPSYIRKIFLDSKFGLTPSLSRVPKGCYLDNENDFRTFVFQQLELNLQDQLTDQELSDLLDAEAANPVKAAKTRKRNYTLQARTKRLKAKKRLARMRKSSNYVPEPFNVRDFIMAATSAKCVAVPETIANKLSATAQAKIDQTEHRAFWASLIPRLAFMFFVFGFSAPQFAVFA